MMSNFLTATIGVIVIIGLLFVAQYFFPKPDIRSYCIATAGQVLNKQCCQSSGDFPNTCLVGACGCSLNNSHQVKVCECPEGACFNGNKCVPVRE